MLIHSLNWSWISATNSTSYDFRESGKSEVDEYRLCSIWRKISDYQKNVPQHYYLLDTLVYSLDLWLQQMAQISARYSVYMNK